MRVFCLCVYTFLICWFPLYVFGAHFVVLGRPRASFSNPLGRASGSQGALLGITLVPLWLPWNSVKPFVAPWAPKGSLRRLRVQNGRPIPSRWLSSSAPAHKKLPRGIQRPQARQRIMGLKCHRSRSSQPHFTRAGGSDDSS